MDLLNWGLTYCGRVYVDDNGIFTFYCNECTVQFGSGGELENHIRTHLISKDKEIELPSSSSRKLNDYSICMQSNWKNATIKENFSDDEFVDDRMSAHSMSADENEDQFEINQSDECDTSQMDETLFFEGDELPIIRDRKRKDLKMLECDICQTKVKGKYNLKVHMNHSHMSEDAKPMCTICNKKVKYLQSHMLQHQTEKPHKCDQCNATYTTNSLLKVHYRKHTGERPFVCFKCGLAFASGSKLTNHMKKHSDVKPFKCEHCGFSFRERYVLKNHIQHVHSGIRPYTCDTCNNTFPSRKAMRQHQNLHVEKKFACKFCDQKFAQGSGRRGHEKRVHGAI